jgi:hypothetical protein
MRRKLIWSLAIGIPLLVYGAFICHRAYYDLVTLDVRSADLQAVLKKMRWQTWEDIHASHSLTGKVSLTVESQPLEVVLDLLSEQTDVRWLSVYPLYRKGNVETLKKAAAGDTNYLGKVWTNFNFRGGFGGFGGGPGGRGGLFMGGGDTNAGKISVQINDKDLPLAALALSRGGGRAQVVVEDGLTRKVDLDLRDASIDQAVEKLADVSKTDWTHFYVVTRGGRPPGGFDFAGRGGFNRGPGEEGRRGPGGPGGAGGRGRMEELLETMTPEDRAKAEERRKEFEAMRNMTPEERQQAMSDRMNSAEAQARMEQREKAQLLNSTPEQGREHYIRSLERQKAIANGQIPARGQRRGER